MTKAETVKYSDWLAALPDAWCSKRLKYSAPLRVERGQGSATDSDYVGLEHIESWTGKLLENPSSLDSDSDDSEAAQGTTSRFVAGDVLLGKLRPYLAKAWLADRDGICTTELLALKSGYDFHPSYLRWVVLCPEFVTLVDSSTFGAKMPRANWDFIGGLRVPVPPQKIQQKIAAYLESNTRKLDGLIEAKSSMLALLESKRAAQVHHTVLRGLNPRAVLKSSRHVWLGEIPAHWEIKRSKRLLVEKDDRSVTGEEEMLTVSHLTGITPRSEKDVNMFEAETNEGYKLVSPDNLVINTLWAWMGAMGVSRHEGIVSPAYHVYRIADELLPAYVDALVRTPAFVAEITRFSKGVWSSRLRLYPEGLHEVWIPVPPLDEQRAIVKHLEAEREGTAEIEKTLRDSISLLQERRRALITAAVTGQIPVEAMSQ